MTIFEEAPHHAATNRHRQGSTVALPARLVDGSPGVGVRIHSGAWFTFTAPGAVAFANQVIDALETARRLTREDP